MRLSELGDLGTVVGADIELRDLSFDSRSVTSGSLFFCVSGGHFDGHNFAATAVAAGAAALVVDHELEVEVPQLVVKDVRFAMPVVASRFFGFPTKSLRTFGVTGTNGKTTSAYMLRSVLESAGLQTGLIGTVETIVGGRRVESRRTTPEAIDLQRAFAGMLEANDQACVMEVSSHALVLGRTDQVTWSGVGFTNLTQDHLDFHGSMDEYFAAKSLLFEQAPEAIKVIDIDDEYGERLAQRFRSAITIGIDNPDAQLSATALKPGLTSTSFLVDGHSITVPMPGEFNVRNALMAYAMAVHSGVTQAAAANAISKIVPPPGRMQPVSCGQDFAVLVDYAHTPDSLRKAILGAKANTQGSVICIFGAGGDRDPTKRAPMGQSASEADFVIVTTDNPRSEAPEKIVEQICEGIAVGKDFEVVMDRRAAISLALRNAKSGDCVLIAGKGHEQGQYVGDEVFPFDDVEVAIEELKAIGFEA